MLFALSETVLHDSSIFMVKRISTNDKRRSGSNLGLFRPFLIKRTILRHFACFSDVSIVFQHFRVNRTQEEAFG